MTAMRLTFSASSLLLFRALCLLPFSVGFHFSSRNWPVAATPSSGLYSKLSASTLSTCESEKISTENYKFHCDESVARYQSLGFQEDIHSSLKIISSVMERMQQQGPDASDYMIRHMARSGYYTGNLVLGAVASVASNVLRNGRGEIGIDFQDVYDNDVLKRAAKPGTQVRMIAHSMLTYEQDYNNIQKGFYNKPWDMYSYDTHNSPRQLLRQTSRVALETMLISSRILRSSQQDKQVSFFGDRFSGYAQPRVAKNGIYPRYYQTAFHYQSEGWMSKESAEVYDDMNETLFLGSQDAMLRLGLVQLVKMGRRHELRKTGRPLRIVEMACGTGRFLSFARDNLPRAEYVATDLSPYYLEKAREMDAYWRQVQKKNERKRNRQRASRPITPAQFVQAKAEDMPFDAGQFDVVVVNNLFHELPRPVRGKVAAEAARLLAPGGLLVFTDSVGTGDYPAMDEAGTEVFAALNEPYFLDYLKDDIPGHFEKHGLVCRTKSVAGISRTLTFSKPDIDGDLLRP